jgi:hypothetical protein
MQNRVQALSLLKAKKHSWFYRHLDNLLFVAEKDYESGSSFIRFIVRSALIGFAAFITTALTVGNIPKTISNDPFAPGVADTAIESFQWQIPILFGILALVIPYLISWIQYMSNQIKSSYDLLEAINLMGKYASSAVDRALGQTAAALPDKNTVKRSLYNLAQTFSAYANETEIQEDAERFSRFVGTTFAIQFTNDLIYAEREGIHYLKTTLRDLAKAMEHQRETILETQSNNSDAVQMAVWINAFVFITCSGSLMYMLGPRIYLELQLDTRIGLILLLFIIVTTIVSLIFSVVLSKPKLDY